MNLTPKQREFMMSIYDQNNQEQGYIGNVSGTNEGRL